MDPARIDDAVRPARMPDGDAGCRRTGRLLRASVFVLVAVGHLALLRLLPGHDADRPALTTPISVRWITTAPPTSVAPVPPASAQPNTAPQPASAAPAAASPAPGPDNRASDVPVPPKKPPPLVPRPLRRHLRPRPAVVAARAPAARPAAAETPASRPAPAPPAAPRPEAPASAAMPVTPPRIAPAYGSNPPPDYPAGARDQRQEGRVLLSVLIAADGRPQAVSVARGSGFPLLDQAAVAAVRVWRFIPARQGAEAVAARVLVPIIFKLRT